MNTETHDVDEPHVVWDENQDVEKQVGDSVPRPTSIGDCSYLTNTASFSLIESAKGVITGGDITKVISDEN